MDEVAADEAGAAGNENIGELAHGYSFEEFLEAVFPGRDYDAELGFELGLVEYGIRGTADLRGKFRARCRD